MTRFLVGLIVGVALMAGVAAHARGVPSIAPAPAQIRIDRICRVIDFSDLHTTRPGAFARACPAEIRTPLG